MHKIRIALVHDAINCRAGGERVLLYLAEAFRGSPIYTSMFDPVNAFPGFRDLDIRTSPFQTIAHNERQHKIMFYPFCIWAMKALDMGEYDVIFMSTTNCSKYIRIPKIKHPLVVAYCFTPFRLAWDPNSYALYAKSRGLRRVILDTVIKRLRRIDYRNAQKVDHFIAMTNETSERIRKCYSVKNEIKVIPPPIDTSNFYVSTRPKDYYLVVSRLEKYKRVDLVLKAFNALGFPLKIVGRGVEKANLVRMARPNIEFVEGIGDQALARIYSDCKCLIFPQHEDFGLTPIEANASGRPVIAYEGGGVLDTMIPYTGNSGKATAVFFEEQTVRSLMDAVEKFESLRFDTQFILNHSKRFEKSVFIRNIREHLAKLYHNHCQRLAGN